jgi:membrane fusion protein (multidrug efflux system)
MIVQRQAAIDRARAAADQARLDLDRYKVLADRGVTTTQQLQQAMAAAASTAATLAEAEAALETERRTRSALNSTRTQTQAQVLAAQALADQARVSLDRTVIKAPVGGVIGKRTVRPGQFVRPGAPILAIVPLGQTYVIANFKETQVSRLRIGQKVSIRADAFGGAEITGRVESFAPATGSEFALIPVENAVGNFTKITQRLPVRIAIDKGSPLAAARRPGLSVSVRVSVAEGGGASFADAVTRAQMAGEAEPGSNRP